MKSNTILPFLYKHSVKSEQGCIILFVIPEEVEFLQVDYKTQPQ